jgi:short-subunit dehydrogenase
MTNFLDLFNLAGKNAVVTGANGILGDYFCEGLVSAGANVMMLDKAPEVVEQAQRLQARHNRKCVGMVCDITSPEDVQAAVDKAVEQLGQIHILHNNAAWKSTDLNAFFAPLEEYSLDTWRQIMSVNIDGMFLVAQSVAKQMIKQNSGGSIIQTSSIYGIMGPDQRIYDGSFYMDRQINTPVVYSASKASVVGLTKYLATYLAKHNIRVNTLTPGGVESGQNSTFTQNYSNRVPLARMARAEEMVGALIYLASDASSYVTGQNLIIDGGLSSW